MKKISLSILTLYSCIIYAQDHQHEHANGYCATDKISKIDEQQYPQIKIIREKADEQIQQKGLKKILQESGFFTLSHQNLSNIQDNYVGEIYQVPVVVHLIETQSSKKLSDEQIQKWIDNANKMFATTYGHGFYPEGTGVDGGTVMPFKLILAKKDPQGKKTTGIKRYDATHITEYNQYGLNSDNTNGVSEDFIRTFAPHWPESSYYNIYIVTSIDGDSGEYGTTGWARYPTVPWYMYDTMMKASVVTRNNGSTLAHEFGHAIGLYHPFRGGNANDCPSNGDCTKDNDMVCDTEPTKILGAFTPSNFSYNSCTKTNYQGGQYNIMNYTTSARKFTPGQRERSIAMFLPNKGDLLKSSALNSPTKLNDFQVTPATCTPPRIINPEDWGIGARKIIFKDIHNATDGYQKSVGQFYVDYTDPQYRGTNVFTDIPLNEESTLTISVYHQNETVKQYAQVWIDWNNDGQFTDNEIVVNYEGAFVGEGFTEYNTPIVPEFNAVRNTYLRMRVRTDIGEIKRRTVRWWERNRNDTLTGHCDELAYGQIEDYAVRVIDKANPPVDTPYPTDPTPPPAPPISNTDYSSRVGINTYTPKATLDVRELPVNSLPIGKPQGVIFPSFTTDERSTFQNVESGTMIYNKTKNCIEFYNGNDWICM